MQALIDNTAAVVIGASILFMLAAMSLKSNDSSIDAAQVDAGKSGLRILVDMVEQDFTNMGAGMENPNADAMNKVVTVRGTESGYQVVKFYTLSYKPSTPTAPQLITYRWKKDGEAYLSNGDLVDTYVVERLVGNPGTLSGRSFDNVTEFEVTLFDQDLNPFNPATGDYHLIRYVNVRMAMVSPLGTEGVVEQTQWSKQFKPINLAAENRTMLRLILPVGP